MESFAIWYDGEAGARAKLNINLWKNDKEESPFYYLDIGMLLYECRKVNFVELYIPQKIGNNDITDLGRLMISDDMLTRAIFNSKIIPKGSRPDHEKYEKSVTVVDDINGNTDILLISFFEGSSFEIKTQDNFTLIQIHIKQLLDKTSQNVYFRLRVNLYDSKDISFDELPKAWFLQSAFNRIETIEFRLNDHRLFNRYIVEQLEHKKLFQLEKAHFFIMRQVNDEVVDGYGLKDIRLLEQDIWKEYINGMNVNGKLIAYHYRKENCSDDVLFFSRIKYQKVNRSRVIIYIGIVIALAVVANTVTHFIFKFL